MNCERCLIYGNHRQYSNTELTFVPDPEQQYVTGTMIRKYLGLCAAHLKAYTKKYGKPKRKMAIDETSK